MKKNKFVLKIGAFMAALFLIVIVLSVANSFLGNPVSAVRAKKDMKKYISEQYSALDLELGKVHYSFKESSYIAVAKSKTSLDTHFSIYYRNGKVRGDEYESVILGKFNTITRIEEEYTKLIIPILSKIRGLEKNRAMVTFEKDEYEKAVEDAKIDMEFDKSLPYKMKVIIRADIGDTSLKNISNLLINSHRVLVENGCIFTSYDIFSEYEGVLAMISDVTPADIEGGELEGLLLEAQNRKEEANKAIDKDSKEGVYVRQINVDIRRVK